MGDSLSDESGGGAYDVVDATAALMRCIPGVRAFLLRSTRDLDLTKDLVQEVIFSVWQSIQLGRLREPAALPAYTLQAARYAALSHCRKARPTTMESLPECETAWGERPLTPLEMFELSELQSLARKVLAELPTERDRELIRGFYIEGRSKAELMAALDLDKDQFDRVISRARSRMRELLHNKLETDTPQVRGSNVRSLHARSDSGAAP